MINGVVGRTTDGFFRYQAWPTVVRDRDGVIYVASSGHRLGHVCPFGKNLMYISRDEGNSWEGPIIINDTYMDDRDAGLCAWGKSNLLLSWFSLTKEFVDSREHRTPALQLPLSLGAREMWNSLPEGQYDPGAFVKISHDNGKTWSNRIRVPMTSPHGPICLNDGSLLYLGKSYLCQHSEIVRDGEICAYKSVDDGYTWTSIGRVPLPEGLEWDKLHEPDVLQLPNGVLLGGIRVHIPEGITIYLTRSLDGGCTWEKPVPTDICGAPPHFLLHSSGAIVMTYGCRKAPCGQRARISYDNGETWSDEIPVGPISPDWDCGYPSSVELSDGSILTVYYQKFENDNYNSILSTRWKLP